jgi:hypothetical protein
MRRCVELTLTRASDLGLGASGVGFGMFPKREDPVGKSLRVPGRRAKTGLRVARRNAGCDGLMNLANNVLNLWSRV